jgi:hypothetical protein
VPSPADFCREASGAFVDTACSTTISPDRGQCLSPRRVVFSYGGHFFLMITFSTNGIRLFQRRPVGCSFAIAG